MSETIAVLSADGHAVPAYVARPAGRPCGGVVVLQEIFGVNSHIRSVVNKVADAGYVAVAPSTFHRVAQNVQLAYATADVEAGISFMKQVEALPAPGVLQDIQAAIDWAHKEAGKVGIVGFCWGGLLSWRAACTLNGLSAAVTYYGGGMTLGAEAERQAKVPVLSHFGAKDGMIPLDTVNAFAQAHPQVQVYVYDADHGFNCEQRASFDAVAQKLAFERTVDLFRRCLD